MPQDRRSFIKRFGATLGSLIVSGSLSGCGPQKDEWSPSTESQAKEQNEPSPAPRAPQWEQLRQCWLSLSTIDRDINAVLRSNTDQSTTSDLIQAWIAARDAVPKKRITDHQVLLDALVATGQLSGPVAKHIQVAFEEAVFHVVRQMTTCYLGFPPEYYARKDLLQQADVLKKISGDLHPVTVAKAQAAIAQDVAFFEIFKADPKDYTSLESNYRTGTLKASPEALEAARLLAQLFVERPG